MKTNQEKLESRVKELFERQDFNIEKDGNRFTAEKDGEKLVLKAFSSEKYSEEDVEENVKNGDKIFVDKELESVKGNIRNDVSVLEEEEDEKGYDLPSYEIIGEIAIINELVGIDEDEAVEGILHHNPQVETILRKKEDGLKGEFRVGDYDTLYGEDTETVHREFGCEYRVDPTKVYFSERFGTERERVVDQVEDGEKVLVMFAGVGPFAVLAAKKADTEKVVAVEKNPEAADYLKENIELNNIEDTVEGIKGDVSEIVTSLEEKFDRVVMPLPGSADQFLETAFQATRENGIIHYYRFLENGNWEELENEIEKVSDELGKDYEIVDRIECGDRSPSETRVCIEIKMKGKKK